MDIFGTMETFFCKCGILQTKITFINKETKTKMNSVTAWIGGKVGGNGCMSMYGSALLLSPEIVITLLISKTQPTMHTCVLSHFRHIWHFATLRTVAHQAPLIFQVRILKWVAMPSSRGSSQPRDGTHISYVSCIDRQVLYHQCHLRSPNTKYKAKSKGETFKARQADHSLALQG